jgi:predicted RNase H-like nuclease (RuvC/YqgF family)
MDLSGADGEEEDEESGGAAGQSIASALAQVLTEQHELQFVEVRQERDRLLEQLGELQRQLASGRSHAASLQSQLQEEARAGASLREQARRADGLEADLRAARERTDRLQAEGDRLQEEIRYGRVLRNGRMSLIRPQFLTPRFSLLSFVLAATSPSRTPS